MAKHALSWLQRNVLFVMVFLTTLFGVSYVAWANGIKELVFPRNFGVVEEMAIYRSARLNSFTADDTLRDQHIGRVISLLADTDDPQEAKPMVDAMTKLGTQRFVCPMNGTGIASAKKYADVLEQIVQSRNEHTPVLIHCSAGSQRTGAVVALYRLLVEKAEPSTVKAEMIRYGHKPRRNPGLIPHLNQCLPDVAQLLVEKGILTSVPSNMPQLTPGE